MTAVWLVFRHTLWQLVWGKKILVVAAAAALPIGIAALVGPVLPDDDIQKIWISLVMGVFVQLMLPLTAIAFALGLISDEVERGTLLYLITRPNAKWTVVVAKCLAYLAVATAMILLALIGLYAVLRLKPGAAAIDEVGGIAAVAPALLLGAIAYGGLFLGVGTVFRKPMIVGVIFAFGWEGLLGNIPGQTRLLSIVYYIRIMIGRATNEGTRFMQGMHVDDGVGVPSATASAIVLIGIFLAGVAIAIWSFGRKQYALSRVQ